MCEQSEDYKFYNIDEIQIKVEDSSIQGDASKQLMVSDAELIEHIFQNHPH
jgi:hypothetical protein